MTASQTTPTVSDRSTEFVAVQGGSETTSAATVLAVAYVLMWAAVFLFVWLSARRQKSLEARLVELERALEARERAG